MSTQPATPEGEAKAKWLAARRQHLTGTDSPKILNLVKWGGPLNVFASKLGLEGEPEDNERMELGRELQIPVANLFGRRTGRAIAHVDNYLLVRHPTIPFIATSLDAFQIDGKRGRGLLEVKLSDPMDQGVWRDDAPVHYQVQLQHELMVTGASWGTLCCLLRGAEIVSFDYDANPKFQATLIAVLTAFWERLIKHEPPEDGWDHPAAKEAIRLLYPTDSGTIIDLPAEADELAIEIDNLQAEAKAKHAEAKAIDEMLEARKNRVRMLMRDAAYGVLADGSGFAWKTNDVKGYTVEPKTSRRFVRMAPVGIQKALKGK